jgi:hypothetical protein
MFHINLLSLQQHMDNLSEFQIPRTEPAGVTILVLRLRLHPEQVTLGARRELQSEDATIGRFARGFVGSEASVLRDHHQIEFGLVNGSAAGAPAEVHQVIFGVEVDVARGRLGLHARGRGRALDEQWLVRGLCGKKARATKLATAGLTHTSRSQIPALKVMMGAIDMAGKTCIVPTSNCCDSDGWIGPLQVDEKW